MGRWLLLLGLVAACDETRTIRLGFGSEIPPRALACEDKDGVPIAGRAFDPEMSTLEFSLVVDFIHLGGVPSCRPSDILDFCRAGRCEPLLSERRCYSVPPMPVTFSDDLAPMLVYDRIRAFIQQQTDPITADAPHEPVLIRAVVTAQGCAAIAQTGMLEKSQLMGCATSCPLQLAAVEGEVVLLLDADSLQCAAGVVTCAADRIPAP